ncbi:MAG TPA: translation initiation factor IF-2 [Nevskiaceae bacterium]|nr:translation initiation factor IF-2 [Nevskiaceae bacterium]
MKNETRPPIVAILGHVDHGKTTLISKIKQVDLTKKEFGGISQHIGAYQIKVKSPDKKVKTITLIDTPGHVAFSKMRSRGAKVADLAILVVAADEGVKPQTLESLKHIKTTKIPYLVAINKIDLPTAKKLDWLKGNLAENKIFVEGYGGDVLAVSVSAKTGKGVDQLLEMVLLLAEMAELKANPQGKLEAVVIESRLDKSRGPLATVLIRDGTLKVGEKIVAEETYAKVKAIFDENGKKVNQAGPAQPVEVLGFDQVPPVGTKIVKSTVEKSVPLLESKKEVSEIKKVVDKEKGLNIILKADVLGTLEAILSSLPEEVKIILSKVGEISESDILLASSTKAEIIGFNIKTPGCVKKLAETEKVEIKTYQVIYDLLDEIEKRILKKLEPTIDEEILGEAKIIAEFEIKGQRIAGCRVKKGQISKKDKVHLKRGKKILGDGWIKSLKIGKEVVEKVKVKDEFGVILSDNLVDFVVGDVLISYRSAAE